MGRQFLLTLSSVGMRSGESVLGENEQLSWTVPVTLGGQVYRQIEGDFSFEDLVILL